MRPALSVEIERGARLFFPEAIRLLFPWSEGPRYPANRAYSFARQAPPSSGTKTPFYRTRIPSGFGRGKISVYKKIYFRICENIFSYMRKFISLRKKIFRRAEGEKFSCPRKEISMRTKINFHAHGNIFLCAQKFCALPTEENFLSERREFPWASEGVAWGRGRRREAKGLHLGGTPSRAGLPL